MAIKAWALTTGTRFKDFAGVSGTADDTLIDILVDVVTETIENYTGRRFKQTTYTDKEYDGTGSTKLVLDDLPVSTFTNLQSRDSIANKNNWTTIDSQDYFVDLASGIITAVTFDFHKGAKLYRATYVAGFDFDNSSSFLSETEAGDVEWVAWELLKVAYNRRKQEPGLASARLGDAAVTYRTQIMDDDIIKDILDKYRRIVIV